VASRRALREYHREAVEIFFEMTIIEKCTKSASDNLFTLYREGLFYKCYNQDAMIFFKYVKTFKVTAKFPKIKQIIVKTVVSPEQSNTLRRTILFQWNQNDATIYRTLNIFYATPSGSFDFCVRFQ
jgi:hypothetical protein